MLLLLLLLLLLVLGRPAACADSMAAAVGLCSLLGRACQPADALRCQPPRAAQYRPNESS